MKRTHTFGLAAATLVVTVGACIDTGRYGFFYAVDLTEVDYVVAGDDTLLRITTTIEVEPSEARILDSALVTVQSGGTSTDFDDPDVTVSETQIFGAPAEKYRLELPSPFDDIDALDSFCNDNGRSADVTLRFYERENDRDPDVDPPLTLVAYTVSLVRAGLPTPSAVFGSLGLSVSSTFNTLPELSPVASDGAGRAVFAAKVEDPFNGGSRVELFDADEDSLRLAGTVSSGFIELPVVFPAASDTFVLAGVDSSSLAIQGLDAGAFQTWSRSFLVSGQPDPSLSALHASAIFKKGPNVLVAAQSSFALSDDAGTLPTALEPPAGKFYGALRLELDPDGNLVDATIGNRDLLYYAELPGGGRVEITSEVPPRATEATLRVERFDAADVSVWAHEEPLLAYRVSAQLDQDGSLLMAVENSDLGSLIEVFRFAAADGAPVFHFSAPGRSPTVASAPGGRVVVGYFGGVVNAPANAALAVPSRSAPLLVELDASGAVTRAAQVACAGTPIVNGVLGSAPLMVGAFRDKVSLGDSALNFTSSDGFNTSIGAAVAAGTVE